MDTNPQETLEQLIHRELSKLPERQAPETLIPRVFAEIQARQRKRWWQKPWTQWPARIQMASLPLMFALACGAVSGFRVIFLALLGEPNLEMAPGWFTFFAAAWEVITALGNAVVVLSRAAGHQWLLLGLFLPLTMYLACVGLGTLCYRVAVHKR
jgi:hypothetical protein